MLSNLLLPGELTPTDPASKARKAAPLAPDARNEPESRVLKALRRAPEVSEAALGRATGLTEEVTRSTVRDLVARRKVQRTTNALGATELQAVEAVEPFDLKFPDPPGRPRPLGR